MFFVVKVCIQATQNCIILELVTIPKHLMKMEYWIWTGQAKYIGKKCVVTWECCLDPPFCKLDGQDILTMLDAIYSKIVNYAANIWNTWMTVQMLK